ncbi:MAG: signal peptidase II [Patescibacteria group bacterium]|jgi:signal peptidase II|nr:signal peptidase II [Patescibacteria group bacterium]
MKKWNFLILLALAFSLLVADQIVKNLSVKNTLPEMGGFLVNYCNPNIAWSIPINNTFFWFTWIFIIILIVYSLKKSFNLPLLFVLFGAISNIIDRITTGCVIDYIKILQFPAFNIADAMITIGIFVFIIQDLLKNKK